MPKSWHSFYDPTNSRRWSLLKGTALMAYFAAHAQGSTSQWLSQNNVTHNCLHSVRYGSSISHISKACYHQTTQCNLQHWTTTGHYQSPTLPTVIQLVYHFTIYTPCTMWLWQCISPGVFLPYGISHNIKLSNTTCILCRSISEYSILHIAHCSHQYTSTTRKIIR